MGRSRFTIFKVIAVGLFALGNGPCDCDDDDNPTAIQFVTISGIVRNIDSGEPAPGIRVTLLATSYSDNVATGTDGAYSLEVPKGSQLYLHTDDFNPAQSDLFFPLINIDLVPVVANGDMLDFPIHCCPQTSCANPLSEALTGSVGAWDHYLQDLDAGNGDMFIPTSSAGSGGILAFLVGDCPKSDSLGVTVTNPAVATGYANSGFFSTCMATERLYPPTRGFTDGSGLAFSFLDPTSTAQTATLQFADLSSAPFRMIASPVTVPVRAGTISLIWGTTVKGMPATFKGYACVCINPAVFCTP